MAEWLSYICGRRSVAVAQYRIICLIYLTLHRFAGSMKKNVDLWSGSHRVGILYGSLTCPSKHQQQAISVVLLQLDTSIAQ